jgi:ssDNA-binding Zn-finger/Zn-ribbon topoisomerase 1
MGNVRNILKGSCPVCGNELEIILTATGTGNFSSQWKNIPAEKTERCPICGKELTSVYTAIGGFPGHEFTHPGSLYGYDCPACHRRFSLDELAKLNEEKTKNGT